MPSDTQTVLPSFMQHEPQQLASLLPKEVKEVMDMDRHFKWQIVKNLGEYQYYQAQKSILWTEYNEDQDAVKLKMFSTNEDAKAEDREILLNNIAGLSANKRKIQYLTEIAENISNSKLSQQEREDYTQNLVGKCAEIFNENRVIRRQIGLLRAVFHGLTQLSRGRNHGVHYE